MKSIQLTINGQKVALPEGLTVLEAAQRAEVYVPTLCNDSDLEPYGACRLCIVQIEGMRGLPTSCTTLARDGMVVWTETEEIRRVRRTLVGMAIANHPYDCLVCGKSDMCDLLKVARYVGVDNETAGQLRRASLARPLDTSNPAFDHDPNKCILCGRCVRVCHDIVGVGAIDFAFRGYDARVSPFGSKPLAQSVCKSCGECVEHCPTGALMPKHLFMPQREIETTCPYCGVGCSMCLGVRDGVIVKVRGNPKSPVNQGQLCVKGRYGLDFVNHPDRLTRPLVRNEGVPKDGGESEIDRVFREVDWDEALDRVAQSLAETRDLCGPSSIGVLSSAKCTNEDNYIVQKFSRTALATNNVDHCARLCHASTVTAALAAFGDGAMSNSIADIDHAQVIFVIGSNTTECHPIIARRIRRATRQNHAKLIVADPRAIELSETAEVHLNHLPGTDVALLNGMMRIIAAEGLYDEKFARDRCEDSDAFLESLDPYTLEGVVKITGVSAESLHLAARVFGEAERAIVLYGMGITQHTTGTDNVKAIANLLMLTGNLGRPGTGFAPLRGQNNVQGACDMGALPNVYPGYQRVDNPEAQEKFEGAWGRELDSTPGRTLTEMMQEAGKGNMKALYIVGENPMLSEPDLSHTEEALANLDFLVVQDIFPTETALLADVILPAASFAEKNGTFTSTERRVQRVRKVIEPPGEARADWEIIAEVSSRLGYPMSYRSSAEVMNEIAELTPIYGGMSYDRLNDGGLQWPCWNREHPGTATLHEGTFTRGRGKFHVVQDSPPDELPSSAYPLLLTTGRILEHWHTGSMSHRSQVLESLVPGSLVEISPVDADQLGIVEGDSVSLTSRRGKIRTTVKTTDRVKPGQAFMPFHWRDAPANVLTNPAVDPLAKIPEYKICSIKAVLEVLERAANDNAFLSALANNPVGALKSYDLSPEHRAALAAGDLESIQEWIGAVDERLQMWVKARLAQESL